MPTEAEVAHKLGNWAIQRNMEHYDIDWRFRTKDARVKLKRRYTSTLLD